MRDDGDHADDRFYLLVKRPKCPRCGSSRFRCTGSRRKAAGQSVRVRYVICAACGMSGTIVVEE